MLSLTLLSTFASSFIWGINTLFLLDAGLTITRGIHGKRILYRRTSHLRNPDRHRRRHTRPANFISPRNRDAVCNDHRVSLALADQGAVLGVGGRVGVTRTRIYFLQRRDGGVAGRRTQGCRFKKELDGVFAKGSIAAGIAMLTGTVAGGLVAQYTNLGVPYVMRIVALGPDVLDRGISDA